jgi:hypothetical protein
MGASRVCTKLDRNKGHQKVLRTGNRQAPAGTEGAQQHHVSCAVILVLLPRNSIIGLGNSTQRKHWEGKTGPAYSEPTNLCPCMLNPSCLAVQLNTDLTNGRKFKTSALGEVWNLK